MVFVGVCMFFLDIHWFLIVISQVLAWFFLIAFNDKSLLLLTPREELGLKMGWLGLA